MAWLIIVTWFARLILLILIGLSVWSIKIILERKKYLAEISSSDEDESLLKNIEKKSREELSQWTKSKQGLRSQILGILINIKDSDSAESATSAFIKSKSKTLEKDLAVLGTLGSTTPFIGLLGTILGIIVSFGELSQGNTDSMKVMYSLAEALILTAVGLGVAIPAVIAFNYFKKKSSELLTECETLKDQFIAYQMRK